MKQNRTIECTVKIYDTTGDAKLLIYTNGTRENDGEMYYLEDGGAEAAIEAAKRINGKKPLIYTV